MLISLKANNIERRLFNLGALLVGAGCLLAGLFYGYRTLLSLVAGGAIAAINLGLLRSTVNSIVFYQPEKSKRRIIVGYFLRLLLIPLSLYAMIRFLFLSIPAAVLGFALFNCNIFVEGILEAVKAGSKTKCTNKAK
jgi:hypothetical protein